MTGKKKKIYIGDNADYERLLMEAAQNAFAHNERYLLVEDKDSIYEIDVKCFLESKRIK